MGILGLTITLIASRTISSGCFLFLLLPGFVGSLSPGCPVLCWVCFVTKGRHLCVIVTPTWTSKRLAWTRLVFQHWVFFFYKYTKVYSRAIVNCTCHFPVNPLYIHHPPSRSRRSRSWCPRSSRGKSLTAEAPAINRINSSQEHSSGRTHQFHYLRWTEAILALCHSAAKVLQAWSPPKPLCRDTTCSNSQMHSVKAFPPEIFI